MSTMRSVWNWATKVFWAAIILFYLFFVPEIIGSKQFGNPPYKPEGAGPWDHKLHCRVSKTDLPGTDNSLDDFIAGRPRMPDVPQPPKDRYLWIKTMSRNQPSYVFVTDATFLAPAYKLGKEWYRSSSHWTQVESGNGTSLCLDYVSADKNHKPLQEPFCAMEIDMGTLEFRTRDDGKLATIGLCEILRRGEG